MTLVREEIMNRRVWSHAWPISSHFGSYCSDLPWYVCWYQVESQCPSTACSAARCRDRVIFFLRCAAIMPSLRHFACPVRGIPCYSSLITQRETCVTCLHYLFFTVFIHTFVHAFRMTSHFENNEKIHCSKNKIQIYMYKKWGSNSDRRPPCFFPHKGLSQWRCLSPFRGRLRNK